MRGVICWRGVWECVVDLADYAIVGATYLVKRARVRSVIPDRVHDFRAMDYEDETFQMVVFDPPHLFVGENSYMATCYGGLNKETWRDDLTRGFSECFRVLKIGGFLIFKWNESDVPLREILALTPYKPMFGHPSGKAQATHWVCFMKLNNAVSGQEPAR